MKNKKIRSRIPDSKIKSLTPDSKIKSYDPVRSKRSIFSVKTWIILFRAAFFKSKIVLINMELNNGYHRTFLVKEKDSGFRYQNKKYIFDLSTKYLNIDSNIYCYDYHENFTLPIKREIPIDTIQKNIKDSDDISNINYSFNPEILENFIVGKVAEGVMKSQMINEFLKKLMMICVIAMISSIIHLLLFIFKTGMLQGVEIPGIN